MSKRHLLALLAAPFLASSTASAQTVQQNGVRNGQFAAAALSDALLADVHGTGLTVPFRRNLQRVGDEAITSETQQMGLTSRIIMDEWWSQTGAALVVANVLASR